jgi:hypothetical protein
VLIPRTCENVTLCGKKCFAAVIKQKLLRWRECPGLSGGASVIIRSFLVRGRYKREGHVMKEVKGGMAL